MNRPQANAQAASGGQAAAANLSRRRFMQGGTVLVLGAATPVLSTVARADSSAAMLAPSVFLAIDGDGGVTITASRSEMGQGVRTALAQIVADELEADWNAITVEQAVGDPVYGDQNTDGSQSIRLLFDTLREAGAAAREMLREAAAKEWGVPAAECEAAQHEVRHPPSGRALGYGQLVAAAAELPVPANPKLKRRADYRHIGKARVHVDTNDVVDGKAAFGMDVTLPNMAHAVIVRPPVLGAAVQRFEEPPAQAGLIAVETLDGVGLGGMFQPLGGVAVIADRTWTAIKVADALQVEWGESPHDGFDSATLTERLRELVHADGERLFDQGDVAAAFAEGGQQVEALYETAFLSHAPMEPPCALANVTGSGCEVWAPVQDPQSTRGLVAQQLGLDPAQVTVNVTLLGGAFGRKSKPDFVLEAVALSKRLKRPVRVTWRREDDIRHDYYHAASAQYHKAKLDGEGRPTAWLQRTAFPSIQTTFNKAAVQPAEWELEMGFSNLPFRVANQRFEYAGVEPGVRIGWLRSVCNIFHSFSGNVFIDELAAAAGQDPIAYRLALLGESGALEVPGMQPPAGHALDLGRLRKVIERARDASDWNAARAAGRHLGFAVHHSFRSYVAAVVEVGTDAGAIKAERAHIVLDCGTYINPDTCKAQMEGAVVFGLSLAMHGEITMRDGRVEQDNFDGYPVLRMGESPPITVDLVDSDALPAGVGEPGVPPVPPAFVNAVFAATGKRHRSLPVRA